MSIRSTIRSVVTMGQGLARGLPDSDVGDDPFALFATWFDEAGEAGIYLPEAMTLSTATPEGRPSARMVLLKGFDTTGFRFFTNFGSRKAHEVEANPFAALTFHWATLHRQVRVEGRVERIADAEAAEYFASRARGSRLGAWASRQSEPLESREALEARMKESEAEFAGDDVPLPPFWGGFRLAPERIEFWQGRANRLHDRVVFSAAEEGWRLGRLYP